MDGLPDHCSDLRSNSVSATPGSNRSELHILTPASAGLKRSPGEPPSDQPGLTSVLTLSCKGIS